MKVFCYGNLHKGLWSVRDQTTRKVTHHLASLTIEEATFKVSEAGRQRVLREGRKNVHAGVEGTLVLSDVDLLNRPGCKVRYNPYTQATFTCENRPIQTATSVRLYPDRSVYALGIAAI